MDTQRLQSLIHSYLQDTITEAEGKELFLLLRQQEGQEAMKAIMQLQLEERLLDLDQPSPVRLERLQQQLHGQIHRETPPDMEPVPIQKVRGISFLRTGWFRWAAVFLLIAATATLFYTLNRPQREIAGQHPAGQPDIPPGGNRATLTLADGTTVLLDTAATGNLADQGTTTILKLKEGTLVYQASGTPGEIMYNTISTPKGGQYQVTLPDGSKVWLNAASSIRFPTVFTKERAVTVTGETYFEVANDRNKPFRVDVGSIRVQVLGTSFDINAYANEGGIKTALLAGSVRVKAPQGTQMLTPGQQTQLEPGGGLVTVKADMEKVMAWKNGLFNFKDADLPTVMRQLERWYDIQVEYEGAIPAFTFQGELERGLHLSQVLKILRDAEVKFRQEGRTLIIMP